MGQFLINNLDNIQLWVTLLGRDPVFLSYNVLFVAGCFIMGGGMAMLLLTPHKHFKR